MELSITYDPFGEITSGVDENFVGYAYNGEESSEVTGLQYLRARYYDTELGFFLTIDSYLGSLDDALSQNRYTYANNDPVNNIDPSGHYSVNVNGASQYYQSTGLNEIRDYMTASALWAGEVLAQNGYNKAVARANNTSFQNYASISGISQSTADSYINKGIAQAGQVSMNYGCSVPTVPNEAVAEFADNVNDARESANAKIEGIKQNKKAQYDEYKLYLMMLEMSENNDSCLEDRIIYELILIYSGNVHGNSEYADKMVGDKSYKELISMPWINWSDFIVINETNHINTWKSLAKMTSWNWFNKYNMQDIVLDMIDYFIERTGSEYSNENLTKAVEEHDVTKHYMSDVAHQFEELLSIYKDDLNEIGSQEALDEFKKLLREDGVFFSKYSYGGGIFEADTYTGLTMTIHGWTQSDIYLTDFETDGKTYSGTLHFKFSDTFGLDETDIDEFGAIAGFRSWYILQHYDKYNGKYKPFDTVVEIDYKFEGAFK